MSSEVELCALNDGDEFGKIFFKIYSTKLQLKEGHNDSHTTFLDLEISVEKGKFIYKIINKHNQKLINMFKTQMLKFI